MKSIEMSIDFIKIFIYGVIEMKETPYRLKYSDGKLKQVLNECKNSIELWSTYSDWKKCSHQESREYRLINADTVLKDINIFIRHYKKVMKETDDMVELANLLMSLSLIEKEKTKKQNKRKGGFKTKETKDKKFEESIDNELGLNESLDNKPTSDWITLNIHPISTNYLYQYVGGKRTRSSIYETWKRNFPYSQVPTKYELHDKYGIKMWESLGLDIDVVMIDNMDLDNTLKGFIDTLFVDCLGLESDNGIEKIDIMRVGTCDDYSQGMIRFRIYNV
jgi:hypothetical protein